MNYQKVYMNQIHSSSLLCQLSQMWKNQLLCDAIIKTGQITTKAHRVVLVAACPMLQSMENASAGSHLEVRLAADIKQESVNTFLQYLYEGFMMLTEENVRDVEKVARLLQVDSVIKCVADFYKCLHTKTGAAFPGTQYKYNFNDLIEFRHVRVTDMQKTVHDGVMKRSSSDFPRPGSPGSKRQRLHRGNSPSDVTVIADDTASMSHSYMSGAPDPWDRVPRLGSGMGPRSATGRPAAQPGVIEIVEESIELVQTEPPEKDSGQSTSRSYQKPTSSISIAVTSQYNTDPDVSIVNVLDKPSSTSQPPGPSSAPSTPQHSSITVSPLTVFQDSQSQQPMSSPSSSSSSRDVPGLATSSTDRQSSFRQEHQSERQTSARQDQPFSGFSHRPESENLYSPVKQQQPPPRSSETHVTSTPQRVPFPVSIASSSSLGKPFAAGSAMQAMVASPPASQSTPVPSKPPRPTQPPPLSLGVPVSLGVPDSSPLSMDHAGFGGDDVKLKSTKVESSDSTQDSTADMTPDLTIVKVEAAIGVSDTGGLDMQVDMPAEHGMMHIHSGVPQQEEFEEPSDAEIEEWAREEMSNEGANVSGDPNSSWYMGQYKVAMSDDHHGDSVLLDEEEAVSMTTPIYDCILCSYTTHSKTDLDSHTKIHQQSKGLSPGLLGSEGSLGGMQKSQLMCDICGRTYQTKTGLKLHVNTKHKFKFRFICEICHRGFNVLCNFRGHMASHNKTFVEKCVKCGATFPHRENLTIHEKFCIGKNVVFCNQCSQSFSNRTSLRQHKRLKHNMKNPGPI